MVTRSIIVFVTFCLVCALADPSVVKHNQEKIHAALATDISSKDLQQLIVSMRHLDETLGTLNRTTTEAIIKRVHKPDDLFINLSPETIEEVLSKTKAVVARKLPKTKRKMTDSWLKEIEKDGVRKNKRRGYRQPYSFGCHFFPIEYPCVEFDCEPVPEVYQPFEEGYPPQSDLYPKYVPEYHPVDSLEPSVRHSILKYMPNIPPELADALFYLEPGFVSYIINHHENLQDLMTKMHTMTVQYVMSYVPELPSLLAKMEPKAIEAILQRTEHHCHYLSRFQDQHLVKIIIGKVPLLQPCLPHVVPEKSTTITTTTTTTTTPAPTTTKAVVIYPPFYTKEDIDEASITIPQIGTLLSLIEEEKLEAIHKLIPSISSALRELSKDQIDFVNTNMPIITDLMKNMTKEELQQVQNLAKDDPVIEFVMGLI
ncbi:unnamed protein product [Rodentolepis nana]|uniref:PABC domain-containing protein n=1 Tax=Rodentolepis nana TaxID=102285 RepID=A0A0R3T419_RODNA|nr:unnamed protein product [Rodentolepis nana]